VKLTDPLFPEPDQAAAMNELRELGSGKGALSDQVCILLAK
jgi:hypothetical protein